jgi:O-antigen/teichoic acid export membrane protein
VSGPLAPPGDEPSERIDATDAEDVLEEDRGAAAAGGTETRKALSASFITSLLLQAAGVITGIILARELGAGDRGALAAAMLWPSLFGAFATLGVEESATYHVARDPSSRGRVIGSGLLLVLLQALLFTAVCAAVIPLVLSKQADSTMIAAFVYLLYIPSNAAGVLLVGTLNGSFHRRAFNAVRLSVGVVVIVIQIGLLATGELTVETMIVGYIAAGVLCDLFAAVLVWRTRPGRLRVDRATMKSMFGYGIRSHASTVPSQLNQRFDQLLISIFLSPVQLGLYVVATTLTSLTAMVGGSVAYVALPSIARLEPGEERTLLARRLIGITLIISATVALPVIVLAPFIVETLFGPSFAGAGEVTRVLAIAVVALSTSRAIEATLRAVGRPLDAGLAEILALGVTMASLAALLPLFGIIGAGLASLLAYMVAGFWMSRRAAAALETRPTVLLVPDRAFVELVARTARGALRRRSARAAGRSASALEAPEREQAHADRPGGVAGVDDAQPVDEAREREVARLRLVAVDRRVEASLRQCATQLAPRVAAVVGLEDVLGQAPGLDPPQHLAVQAPGDQPRRHPEVAAPVDRPDADVPAGLQHARALRQEVVGVLDVLHHEVDEAEVDARVLHRPAARVLDRAELVDEGVVRGDRIDVHADHVPAAPLEDPHRPPRPHRVLALRAASAADVEGDPVLRQELADPQVERHRTVDVGEAAEARLGVAAVAQHLHVRPGRRALRHGPARYFVPPPATTPGSSITGRPMVSATSDPVPLVAPDAGRPPGAPGHTRLRALGFLAAALVAGGLIALLTVLAIDETRNVLLIAMAVISLLPLVVRAVQRRFDPFEPIQIFAVGIFVCFVARPFVELHDNLSVYAGMFVRSGFNGAMAVCLVGTVALYVAYASGAGRWISDRAPRIPEYWDVDRSVRFGIGMLVLSFVLLGLFALTAGGPGRVFTLVLWRNAASDDTVLRNSSGWLYLGPYLTIPASLIFLAAWHRKKTPRTTFLLALSIGLALFFTVPRGDRTYVLALIMPLAVLPSLRRGTRPKMLSLVVAIVLAVTAINVLLETRNVGTRDDAGSTIVTAITNPTRQFEELLKGPDVSFFSVLELQYEIQPDSVPFRPGSTPISIFGGPVPGALWAEKPIPAVLDVIYYLFYQQSLISRASNDPAMFGDFYADGGFYTTVLYALLLGIALRTLWEYFLRNSRDASVQIIFASSLPLMVILLRGALTDTVARSVVLLGPLIVCAWVCSRPPGHRLPTIRRGQFVPVRTALPRRGPGAGRPQA